MNDTARSRLHDLLIAALMMLGSLGQTARTQPVVKGTVVTFAGTGAKGFSGDGGPALKAQLNDPAGIVRAPDGTLYICDTANHRIRKVTRDGNITTVAGTGEAGWSGDG